MNDHEIQERLTDVARQEYEKGGTTFPPGNFFYFYVFHFERIHSNHMKFVETHPRLKDHMSQPFMGACPPRSSYQTKRAATSTFTCPMQ